MQKIPSNRTRFVLFAATAALSASVASAHTGETHEAATYDPVQTAFGEYDPALEPDRVIEVKMNDAMRFVPETIDVKANEVVRFTLINEGKLMHEFVLGTEDSLNQHAEMMRKHPGMEHDEPYMAHVEPGQSGDVVWRFSEGGRVAFGCLIPGHFEAGMKGIVDVR